MVNENKCIFLKTSCSQYETERVFCLEIDGLNTINVFLETDQQARMEATNEYEDNPIRIKIETAMD